MKTGLIYTTSRRQAVYRQLKRQVAAEFQMDIERATGWRSYWLRLKRSIILQIRYNEFLFSGKSKLHSSLA